MHHPSITVAITLALFAGSAAAQRGGPTSEDLWKNNCASCHGARAEGVEGKAKSLLGIDEAPGSLIETDRRYHDAVRNGIKGIEGHNFSGSLNEAQSWATINRLREFQAADRRRRVGAPKEVNGVFTSQHASYAIETVVGRGLKTPWSVEFLSGGRLLITERGGALRIFTPGAAGEPGTLSDPVQNTPATREIGQGGMMDVTLHPEFDKNGWIYLGFADFQGAAEGARAGSNSTKVVRGRIKEENGVARWTDEEVIFQAKPEHYQASGLHFGIKIVFDPPRGELKPGQDRYVYFAIGERGAADLAQDLGRPNGKVYRLHDDGRIPKDNPFVGRSGVYEAIWSYGHRNPQGLVFDLEGNLWDTEHAPRGGDELNLVKKGRNYGWPRVSFGINYSGSPLTTPWPSGSEADGGDDDFVMPTDRWLPSIAVCGLEVVHPVNGKEGFPQWRGDLLAGGLAGQIVDRVRIKDGKVIEREEIVLGKGRIRDIACGPDGNIYIVTESPDRVVRLVPREAPAGN